MADPVRATLLLLGGTDQIGIALQARAASAGWEPIAIGRSRPTTSIAWQRVDLGQAPSAPLPIAQSAIATAPIWLVADCLPALQAASVARLVAFSSTSVTAKSASAAAADRAIVARLASGEQRLTEAAARAAIELTILRPTMIYGLGLDANVTAAARWIERWSFFPVAGRAQGLRQPVHAEDLAATALSALRRPESVGKSYQLGGGEQLTYRAMIERIGAALGRRPRLLTLPEAGLGLALGLAGRLTRRPALTADLARRMNQDQIADNGPAERDLGYRPRAFLAGGRADLGR